jgi:lysophospholipase L1-like esterase
MILWMVDITRCNVIIIYGGIFCDFFLIFLISLIFVLTANEIMYLALVLLLTQFHLFVASQEYLEGVEFLGRFNKYLQADWSGTGILFQVKATSSLISINLPFVNVLDGTEFYIGVEANCEEVQKFVINSNSQSLHFEQAVKAGSTYEFSLRKLTEASFSTAKGTMQLGKLQVSGGRIITSSKEKANICPRSYKMLSIGDSITCAYGVDQLDPCSFTTSTEDVRHGYAFLVAKDIKADIHTLSWSGKGVVRNNGDPNPVSTNPFPIYYNRTIAITEAPTEQNNYWRPSLFTPDIVTIMLGTNDYSTQPNPTDEQYTSGLITFITQIQSDYPHASIVAICSPMAKDTHQCPNIESATKATNVHYIDIPENVFDGGYGCVGHPSQQTQRNMADYILPTIRAILESNK